MNVLFLTAFAYKLSICPSLFCLLSFPSIPVSSPYNSPKYSLLGPVPGTDIYRPVEDYNQVNMTMTPPTTTSFQITSTDSLVLMLLYLKQQRCCCTIVKWLSWIKGIVHPKISVLMKLPGTHG